LQRSSITLALQTGFLSLTLSKDWAKGAQVRKFLAIGIMLVLGACAGGNPGSLGNLNPFNWFGGGNQRAAAPESLLPARAVFVVDSRAMVDQITGLSVEKTPTGAIVRATALTPAQGYYNAGLVVVASARAGDLTLQFRARPPGQTTAIGPPHLRELVVGYALSTAQVRGIRRIHVVAARNSRSVNP